MFYYHWEDFSPGELWKVTLFKDEESGAFVPKVERYWEMWEGRSVGSLPSNLVSCGMVSVEAGAREVSGTEVKVLAVASLSGSTLKDRGQGI